MSEAKNPGGRLLEGLSNRTFQVGKYLYQHFAAVATREPKRILFIVGCQRSGTTLMRQIFDRDLDAKVYAEYSEITRSYRNLRLKPLEAVKRIIERSPARLIIAKPLAETQNTLKLLSHFPGSKALFMYRNFRDVASSSLKQFGMKNGIDDLRPIAKGAENDWRTDSLPEHLRAMIADRFSEDMNPCDAAALFWYVRNRLFFDLGLDRHPSVVLFRYEDLVADPAAMIAGLYGIVGMAPPAGAARLVHASSVGKGKDLQLSTDVEALCRGLLERLEDAYHRTRGTLRGSRPGKAGKAVSRYGARALRHPV